MATIESGNWSFLDPGVDVPDGSIINGGNFSQVVPGTAILVGKTLTINGGNFTNVLVDVAWTINGGNFTQVSRCANLNPKMVASGHLAAEPENCPHVVDTDTITIDGEIVDTVYHYEDTAQ